MLQVGVEVAGGGDGFFGREEVEPGVGEGDDLRQRSRKGQRCVGSVWQAPACGLTETSMPCVSINLIFSARSQY